MTIAEWAGLIVSILTIIGIVSAFIYKIIRNELRDELVPIMTSNFTTLDKKIEETNKASVKYMGKAFEEKLKEYEEHNEEIRTIRSEKYMTVIENMKESIERGAKDSQKNTDILLKGLEHIKDQINSNSIKTAENKTRIDLLEKGRK